MLVFFNLVPVLDEFPNRCMTEEAEEMAGELNLTAAILVA